MNPKENFQLLWECLTGYYDTLTKHSASPEEYDSFSATLKSVIVWYRGDEGQIYDTDFFSSLSLDFLNDKEVKLDLELCSLIKSANHRATLEKKGESIELKTLFNTYLEEYSALRKDSAPCAHHQTDPDLRGDSCTCKEQAFLQIGNELSNLILRVISPIKERIVCNLDSEELSSLSRMLNDRALKLDYLAMGFMCNNFPDLFSSGGTEQHQPIGH